MKKIYILLVAIFAISSTSCSDYLDSDYIFEDRETIDKVLPTIKNRTMVGTGVYLFVGTML